MTGLPFSQACENNKPFILEVLQDVFSSSDSVLEIASGTGQHACYFAGHMPWLEWQPTDLQENLALLHPRCADYEGDNLLPALALDVRDKPWPVPVPRALFTANSLHIMPFTAVEAFFSAVGHAVAGTILAVYGPFNYGNQYTSESNARFDQWLKQRDPQSGIRHFEEVDELAAAAGFSLQGDNALPANNRLVIWQKTGASGACR